MMSHFWRSGVFKSQQSTESKHASISPFTFRNKFKTPILSRTHFRLGSVPLLEARAARQLHLQVFALFGDGLHFGGGPLRRLRGLGSGCSELFLPRLRDMQRAALATE